MATVRTSFQMRDGMTRGLKQMTKSINMAISSFEHMQTTSGKSVDTAQLKNARAELNKAEMAFNDIEHEIKQANAQQQKFNKNVNNSSGGAKKLLRTVRNIAIAVGGITIGRKFFEAADQYAGIQARLGLINDGQQTTTELNEMIFRSANRARGSYSDMADVIGKLGITASQAFRSNEEMLRFSELMTKSFKIAGASAQEQSAAMYQLTQAMAAGRLQGDEFRSILENAPMLAQSIAQEMDVTLGVLKEMSSEGKITSNVIKNSLFNSAHQINEQFRQMPIRFDEMVTKMKNKLTNKLRPAFAELSQWLNSVHGEQAMNAALNGVAKFASGVAFATQKALALSLTIQRNWSTIEPVVFGLVGAIAAYNTAVGIATIATGIHEIAMKKQELGLYAATKAQWGFNAAVLANPLTYVAIGLGIGIALLARWVKNVGGAKIAFMIFSDKVRSAIDKMKISFLVMRNAAITAFDSMNYKLIKGLNNVLNFMGTMKVKIFNILQDMINGAINRINKLISLANNVPGVSIQAIGEVAFGTEIAIKEQAKRDNRAQIIENARAQMMSDIESRQRQIDIAFDTARAESLSRQYKIDAAQKTAQADPQMKKTNDYLSKINGASSQTASNTGAMKDSLDIAEEDIKYMRDIAEREVIDRTVLRDINVDFKSTFGDIRETADVDGVLDKFNERLNQIMNASAEGVSNA